MTMLIIDPRCAATTTTRLGVTMTQSSSTSRAKPSHGIPGCPDVVSTVTQDFRLYLACVRLVCNIVTSSHNVARRLPPGPSIQL